MTIQDILSRLKGVKGGNGQWTACCPNHGDTRQSLSVSVGKDGKVLLHCHTGCAVEDIVWSMGLQMKDLFVDKPPDRPSGKPPIIATYAYPSGAQKLRRADKSFLWRHPDGKGGWVWNRKGVPRELYIAGELSGVIHVVEGEKDADNVHAKIGGCAVCGQDGAGPGKWRKEYTEQLRGRPVVILPDNDDVGRAYAQETAAALRGVAKSVRLVDLSECWPEIPEHGDISDMIEAKSAEEAARLLVELEKKTPEWEPTEAEENSQVQPLQIMPAPVLQTADLPPVKFLIEGILPDGTSLLTAASKIGKSWMVLDLGLCQAAGKPFMGHQTNQCGVLYLALEDSLHRLQNRMNKILKGKPAPEQFYFATEAPKLDNGLLDTLDDHLKKNPDTRLIIIDTLQKIRGQALPREAAYAQDYREMETVKSFLDKRGVSAIFVHHNRKMRDDDDPFNMISGTNGIMGAADTIWTITKAHRADEEATLHITGRDVEQSDTVIRFDKGDWRWKPVGSADWLAEQRARLEYDGSPIVKTIKKLLDQSPGHRWDGTAKDLMDAGKYIARTYLAPSTKKLGKDIAALEKPLFDYDGIVHSAGSNGTGGKKHSFYYQDLSQFEELEGDQEEMPWQTDSKK
ncbi:MAG: AAA family ATPase [Ruminococcaceae bacterium]|nr:AAA family ATPase [Oscillospiraceae bacterium]